MLQVAPGGPPPPEDRPNGQAGPPEADRGGSHAAPGPVDLPPQNLGHLVLPRILLLMNDQTPPFKSTNGISNERANSTGVGRDGDEVVHILRMARSMKVRRHLLIYNAVLRGSSGLFNNTLMDRLTHPQGPCPAHWYHRQTGVHHG